jgi:WD40 repeat protein
LTIETRRTCLQVALFDQPCLKETMLKQLSKARPPDHGIGPSLVLVLVASGLVAIDASLMSSPIVKAASSPDFVHDVFPILQKNCASCHSSSVHKSGFSLDSYDALMKGGKHGPDIVPHDSKASRLVEMLEGDVGPQMPLEADPLRDSDIAVIKSWIDAGAAGPGANAVIQSPVPQPIPEIRPTVPVVSPVSSVKFSPDGSLLAIGGYKQIRLIDPASGTPVGTLSGHADAVRSLAFDPEGKRLAAAGGRPQLGGEIKIWDVSSHRLLRTLEGHKDCIYSVAWSPDGKLLASGSYDRLVKLWDASTGRQLSDLQDHIDAVFAVAFSPDGKRLATASQDRTVKVWDVATGKRLYTLSDASDGLTSLAFSPAGDRVAAAGYDKTIYVWKLGDQDGSLLESLIADQDSVLALAWSSDGNTLVTASSDGSIRFRNPKLELTGLIDRQPDWVDALDLSRDGKWLAAGRLNGSLSLYDAKSGKEALAKSSVFEPPKENREETAREAATR